MSYEVSGVFAVSPNSLFFWLNSTMGNKSTQKSRNIQIQAKEIALKIELKDLTKTELARKLEIIRIQAMGDHWERRLLTERMLRGRLLEVNCKVKVE